MLCFHVSDLHGKVSRYEKLFEAIRTEHPFMVFIGGDILPGLNLDKNTGDDFIVDYIGGHLKSLMDELMDHYPAVYVIPGNDDGASCLKSMQELESRGLWKAIICAESRLGRYTIYGYPFVPPTPFLLKDWEKYDISQYVDPGCVSPEEGYRSKALKPAEIRYATIQKDLNNLAGDANLSDSIFLFHSPPHQTKLDRAALDGKLVEHVQPDVHVGSIAIRRFIQERQPRITLHGHIHESTRITGNWKDKLGETYMFNAAHDGPELSLIRFDPENPAGAERELI